MLANPVHSWKSAPATSGTRLNRSTACASDVSGGQRNKLGKTLHNFASNSGIDAMPVMT